MQIHRVYFAPRKFEMERFRNIAQHPVFSKTVKELVFDARLFREEYREKEAYETMLSLQTCFSQDRVNVDPSELERYSSCVEEQAHILDNKLDYHALLAGLGRMSIICLTVQDVFASYGQLPNRRTDHSWYNETCNFRFPTLLPLNWYEYRLPFRWDDQAPVVLPLDCRGLAHLFHAISEQCSTIDELHIGTQESRAPMVLFQPSSGFIDHIDRLAPRLTCLKLDCEPYVSERNHDTDAAASRLANSMSNAKSLRALSLSSSIGIDERSPRCILRGRQAWTHLSLLDLGHMRTTQETLAAIIGAQRDTLSELALRYIMIQGLGSWESLGDNIGQSLRLRKITLSELSFEDSHMCVALPHHTEIAMLFMRWASPEMLETKCPARLSASVLVKLKSKGENVLVD